MWQIVGAVGKKDSSIELELSDQTKNAISKFQANFGLKVSYPVLGGWPDIQTSYYQVKKSLLGQKYHLLRLPNLTRKNIYNNLILARRVCRKGRYVPQWLQKEGCRIGPIAVPKYIQFSFASSQNMEVIGAFTQIQRLQGHRGQGGGGS